MCSGVNRRFDLCPGESLALGRGVLCLAAAAALLAQGCVVFTGKPALWRRTEFEFQCPRDQLEFEWIARRSLLNGEYGRARVSGCGQSRAYRVSCDGGACAWLLDVSRDKKTADSPQAGLNEPGSEPSQGETQDEETADSPQTGSNEPGSEPSQGGTPDEKTTDSPETGLNEPGSEPSQGGTTEVP